MVNETTPRGTVLDLAKEAVTKQRNNTYGEPTQDFQRSAQVLNAMGFVFVDAEGSVDQISPHHVAMIQIAVKLSRASWNPSHLDSWVDIAGYAACAYECVEEDKCEN